MSESYRTVPTVRTVPISRLGEEAGWTTVHYHSKYQPHRREIWRYQWDKRFELDDNKAKLFEKDRDKVRQERRLRDQKQQEDLDTRNRRDKFKFSTVPEQHREDRQQSRKTYRKAMQNVLQDNESSRESEALEKKIKWTQDMAKIRQDRRRGREQQREQVLGKPKKEEEIDSYYLAHADV